MRGESQAWEEVRDVCGRREVWVGRIERRYCLTLPSPNLFLSPSPFPSAPPLSPLLSPGLAFPLFGCMAPTTVVWLPLFLSYFRKDDEGNKGTRTTTKSLEPYGTCSCSETIPCRGSRPLLQVGEVGFLGEGFLRPGAPHRAAEESW